MIRSLVFLMFAIVTIVGIGEVVARYALGLGTPPLSIPHERIEYMFAPNQDVKRFGNRQLYNEYGMRNTPMDQWGTARRVLVFGDSVLNGGNLTDHRELATTLASAQSPETVFGNISAGSWGPDNILGWIETYGLLDAETAILVLSAHDAGDAPSYESLDPTTHPTERPLLALSEGITRYAPKYLPAPLGRLIKPTAPEGKIATQHVGRNGIDVLPTLFDTFADTGVQACVVLHATRSEYHDSDFAQLDEIAREAQARTVPVVRMYEVASDQSMEDLYRDDIHINYLGQSVLADALMECKDSAVIPTSSEEE